MRTAAPTDIDRPTNTHSGASSAGGGLRGTVVPAGGLAKAGLPPVNEVFQKGKQEGALHASEVNIEVGQLFQ